MADIKYDDIQGLVFSGYDHMEHASYHLLRSDSSGRANGWLKELLAENRITPGQPNKEARRADWCLNVAFTAPGLAALGLVKDELETFEAAFLEGMDEKRRSRILGDVGSSAPESWDWGHASAGKDASVHAVLMIFARDEIERLRRDEIESNAYTKYGLVRVRPALIANVGAHKTNGFSREHFGFADGLSQPWIPDINKRLGGPPVAVGEFILGHANAYGRKTAIPLVAAGSREFGRNGTYLVFRQLQQDVAKFWQVMRVAGGAQAELIAAKAVGRWPSGALVEPGAAKDPGSVSTGDFGFSKSDPQGMGCPFGSHIRRANPRDTIVADSPEESALVSGRHRLLRRGRSYGERLLDMHEDDGRERGLLFLCLNANIDRQFEFVQQTWINNKKFGGAYDEIDPLIGAVAEKEEGRMTLPGCPIRARVGGLQRFVVVRGGAYFFLPGLDAIRYLAGLGSDRVA